MAHRGRPLSAKTLVDRQLGRNRKNLPQGNSTLPAGESYIVPNYSGVDNYIRDVAGDIWVRTAGDTMTGNLVMSNNNVNQINTVDFNGTNTITITQDASNVMELRKQGGIADLAFSIRNSSSSKNQINISANLATVLNLIFDSSADSLEISSEVVIKGAVLDFEGDTMRVGNKIEHFQDSNTHISFGADRIIFTAGDVEFLRINEGASDTITMNSGGGDVDVQIRGDTDSVNFFSNAGTDRIGIGTQTPSTKLDVLGTFNASAAATFGSTGAFTGDVTVSDEAYDATNWNGSFEVPTKNAVRDKIETLTGHGSAYICVTTNEDSDSLSSEADVFDQDNYPDNTLTLDTATVAPLNITFTPANGRFTVDNPGIYEITVTVLIRNAGADSNGNSLDIQKNDVTEYQHEFERNASGAQTEQAMSLSIIMDMDATQYINVRGSFGTTAGSPTFIFTNGCTITMKQIANDP